MTLNKLVESVLKEWELADRETISMSFDDEVLVGDKLFGVYAFINHKGIEITLNLKEKEK